MDCRLLCPWNSPGKNTGVGCQSLLQRIFPTQGSNPGFSHCLGCKNLKENILQPSLEVGKPPMQQSWLRNNVPWGMVTSRNKETQALMGENDASVHTAHAGLREAQVGRSGRCEQAENRDGGSVARAQALEWNKLGCHLGTLHQPLICSAAQWAHLETLGQGLFHRIDEGLNENALVVEGLNVRITKSMVDNYILMYLVFITESRVQEKWWHVFSIPVTELETQCESQMLLLPHWPCSHSGGLSNYTDIKHPSRLLFSSDHCSQRSGARNAQNADRSSQWRIRFVLNDSFWMHFMLNSNKVAFNECLINWISNTEGPL